MGRLSVPYLGSARTTRRETAAAKRALRSGQRRVFKPWIPEPGGWLQFDWGASPTMNRPGFAGGSEPTEGGAMPAPRKYSNELRERAKRLVAEAACRRGLRARAGTVVERGGAAYRPACVNPDTLRGWCTQADIDAGRRPGITTGDAATIKQLEAEVRELKRANEILSAASSFFARELDPRPPW